MSNENEDFDLFATDVEDNLQETLAKGGYRWTNKYTAILAGLVLITASVSGGIWYGNKHAASSGAASLAGFASRIRGAAAGGAFTGAAGAAGGAGAAAGDRRGLAARRPQAARLGLGRDEIVSQAKAAEIRGR